jgi:hypothetical protein
MSTDSRLEASIRYAAYFLGGVVLLATGVWVTVSQIGYLVECATVQGLTCPTSPLITDSATV